MVVTWLDGISVYSHISTAEVLTPPLVCIRKTEHERNSLILKASDLYAVLTKQINSFVSEHYSFCQVFYGEAISVCATTRFTSHNDFKDKYVSYSKSQSGGTLFWDSPT